MLSLRAVSLIGVCSLAAVFAGGVGVASHAPSPAAPAVPAAAPFVPHWTKMPLLSPAQARAGHAGGEGGQWPRGAVAVSPADPNFLLLPIDVGGLYRSLDGGRTWNSALVGWNARGANGFAIDPRNADRVIGIAGNSMDWNQGWGASPHGLYLSTNKAASWRQRLAFLSGTGGAAAYDPTSYDAAKKYCMAAYYLSSRDGVFRSQDGGTTWQPLADSPRPGTQERDWTQGGGIAPCLAVSGKDGAVYVGGASGLYRSANRGQTWTHVREAKVYSLCLAPDGTVYASGPDKITHSRDGGKTWQALSCTGLDTLGDKPIQNVALSPADPRRMLCWVAGANFQWPRYLSEDGGATWQAVSLEKGEAFLPSNARQSYATWHPADPKIAWTLGGDWITRSQDGGKTFHWSNDGYNGIMAGGLFNLSVQHPDAAFVGFQDYNGATTLDGGHTWNWRDVSGKGWGGHVYGGYALDAQTMWGGEAESWGTPRRLRVSHDGGATWAYANGADGKPLVFAGPDVSLSDPTDDNICFASNFRSHDRGQTWQPMTGCDAVFTYGIRTDMMFGKKDDCVVGSVHKGVQWLKLTGRVEGGFDDLAVDPAHQNCYVASQERLKVWEPEPVHDIASAHPLMGKWKTLDTPRDQYGNIRVTTVAVDPQAPNVIYIGGPRNTYASQATVCRSADGGATWTNLTVTTPLDSKTVDGPHEVSAIRVHPITREAWVAGQCYGLWRIAPPAKDEKGVSASAASAPRVPAP